MDFTDRTNPNPTTIREANPDDMPLPHSVERMAGSYHRPPLAVMNRYLEQPPLGKYVSARNFKLGRKAVRKGDVITLGINAQGKLAIDFHDREPIYEVINPLFVQSCIFNEVLKPNADQQSQHFVASLHEVQARTLETDPKPGSVVSARFTQDTNQRLWQWGKDHAVENLINPQSFHSTIIYSEKPFDFQPLGIINPPIKVDAGPRTMEIFGKNQDTLVMHYQSKWLEDRFAATKQAGGESQWPDFKAHVTFSYNCLLDNCDHLAPPDFPLYIDHEVVKPIDDNWTNTAELEEILGWPARARLRTVSNGFTLECASHQQAWREIQEAKVKLAAHQFMPLPLQPAEIAVGMQWFGIHPKYGALALTMPLRQRHKVHAHWTRELDVPRLVQRRCQHIGGYLEAAGIDLEVMQRFLSFDAAMGNELYKRWTKTVMENWQGRRMTPSSERVGGWNPLMLELMTRTLDHVNDLKVEQYWDQLRNWRLNRQVGPAPALPSLEPVAEEVKTGNLPPLDPARDRVAETMDERWSNTFSGTSMQTLLGKFGDAGYHATEKHSGNNWTIRFVTPAGREVGNLEMTYGVKHILLRRLALTGPGFNDREYVFWHGPVPHNAEIPLGPEHRQYETYVNYVLNSLQIPPAKG